MYSFLERDPELENMIESSKYLCMKNGVNKNAFALPEVTEEDIERCKKHVSGHIRMMRRSTPAYYESLRRVLDEHKAVLLYMVENFDVFGRRGNQQLKDELAAINLKLGTNLSEDRAGTNAAVMASRRQEGVWVIGDEHYSEALRPYACYAFRINGKYNRNGFIMLITYKENLDEKINALFHFVENTECIVTAGLAAEDMVMRETVQKNEISKGNTSDIVLMVDRDCIITFVNDVYYDYFNQDPMNTINQQLSELRPELAQLLPYVRSGQKIMAKSVILENRNMRAENFLADCTPIINTKSEKLGSLITLYKPKNQLTEERKSNAARYTFADLYGVSNAFVKQKQFAQQISKTRSPILIYGESGTGKELFANSIHNASEYGKGPFVALNCAAIPKDLIGSELFGYVDGAFTGAKKGGNIGKFELANGGTLFLDEIGEMPLEMQSVLLRALEEKRVSRIGASKSVDINVRIITATNKDLQRCVNEGSFREDLFYRLNVISLKMIPLRERREDIPVLADAFIKRFSEENSIFVQGIATEAMSALIEYAWPGNIRELRNVIERCVVICRNGYIELEDLPANIKHQQEEESSREAMTAPLPAAEPEKLSFSAQYLMQRRETAEKLLLEFNGNKSLVAKKMGISRSTLYRVLSEK